MNIERKEIANCISGCPLGIDIPNFIGDLIDDDYPSALNTIWERNPFPGITGRICTAPCEYKCIRNQLDQPVAIKQLERYISDREFEKLDTPPWDLKKQDNKSVSIGIIGAGPAGILCAHDLLRMGYRVSIYDSLPKPGGLLAFAIPSFHLPRDILFAEIQMVEKLGAKFILNCTVGKDISLTELRKRHQAVLIAIGAHKTRHSHIPGKNLVGVFNHLDFLKAFHLNKLQFPIRKSTKAIVIGGETCDSFFVARVLKRLGAEVHILFKKPKDQYDDAQIKPAYDEQVFVRFSILPTSILGVKGKICGIRCVKVEYDNEKKPKYSHPIPIQDSEFEEDCDLLCLAETRYPDIDSLGKAAQYLKTTPQNTLQVDKDSANTNIYGVFAAGEVVSGPADVITSMAQGRKSAMSIHNFINEIKPEQVSNIESHSITLHDLTDNIEGIYHIPRNQEKLLPADERKNNFSEVVIGFDETKARNEAERCVCFRLNLRKKEEW
ncbi:hypothetical protein DRQ33_01140 [bacterium]|nr:MAG: hypothetical protein DRQ33_01140 [bacterium]